MYIPRVPVREGDNIVHPLKIAINKNTTNSYKVLRPDISIDEEMKNLSKKTVFRKWFKQIKLI